MKIKSLRTDIYQEGKNYLVLNVPYDMVQFINGKYLINQSQYYKAKKIRISRRMLSLLPLFIEEISYLMNIKVKF